MKELVYAPGGREKPGEKVDRLLKNTSKHFNLYANQDESYKRGIHRALAKLKPNIERFPNPTDLATWVIPESMSHFLNYDSLATLGKNL